MNTSLSVIFSVCARLSAFHREKVGKVGSDHLLPLRIPMHSSLFSVLALMAFRGAGALSFTRSSILQSRPVHTTARQSHSQVFFPYVWSWELEACLRRRHFTTMTSMRTDLSSFLMNIFRCGPLCLSFGCGCDVCLFFLATGYQSSSQHHHYQNGCF